MERVNGIGGLFFRAQNPQALSRWYAEALGVGPDGEAPTWQQERGLTVWAPFDQDTEYFGRREQAFMVNFRVRDLDAMLAQLRAAGAKVEDRVEEADFGRFGWAADPEGNRFELWQPLPAEPDRRAS